MHIYFSGVGGVGIGPLAEIAADAGNEVTGSDSHESLMTKQLQSRGIPVTIGQDTSTIEAVHTTRPIDWFVYTAALPNDHPELRFAREHGIRTSKRDELLAHLLKTNDIKLIAVSGTHGKTTTTGMLIWVFSQLGLPLSYSVGTTLSFAPSGKYDKESPYFVYECDEYDRNMLHFEPYFTLITALDYDHPDTYKNEHEYKDAFIEFIGHSHQTVLWEKDWQYLGKPEVFANVEAFDEHMNLSYLSLPGDHVRHNAFLVERTLAKLLPDQHEKIQGILNTFPGTGRRFEKLADNLYSDYGHHPAEIAATLQLANEISDHVVLIYQPHQNIRQHEVRDQYVDCMQAAKEIYWLPTYLSREDPNLEVLTPEQLSSRLTNKHMVKVADMNESLWEDITEARREGKLVLVMGAGSIDAWIREKLNIVQS